MIDTPPQSLSRLPVAILAVLAFWLGVGLLDGTQHFLLVSQIGREEITLPTAFLRVLPGWIVWAMLSGVVVWVTRHASFEPGRRMRSAAIHLFCFVSVVLAHELFQVWWAQQTIPRAAAQPFWQIFQRDLTFTFHLYLLIYLAIVGAWHAYDYYRRYRERQRAASELALRASQLEASLADARLRSLEMQLHPHFLFNTLQTISALMLRNEPRSSVRMIATLSDLLRMALDRSDAQLVPIEKEIEFLRRYLEIEQTRFRDRMSVEIDVDPETADAAVPSLVLQPLVENAIRHGIGELREGGSIRVSATRDGDTIRLSVYNDGPPLREEREDGRQGIGLRNTTSRLAQLFGASARLDIFDVDGGVQATIEIPYRRYPSNPDQSVNEASSPHRR